MIDQHTLLHILCYAKKKEKRWPGCDSVMPSPLHSSLHTHKGNYPNTHWEESLENLFITGRQVRSIRREIKATEAYLLCHNDFNNVDFYAASINLTITVEGPSESFFESPIRGDDDNNAIAKREMDEGVEENSDERQLLPLSFSAGQNMTGENCLDQSNAGFTVDENNEPVTENISVAITVDAVDNTTIDKTPLLVSIGALLVSISVEHQGMEFFSLQIEGKIFFIHSMYIYFGIFPSFLTI